MPAKALGSTTQAVGKTVKGIIGYGALAVIAFADGSYLRLEAADDDCGLEVAAGGRVCIGDDLPWHWRTEIVGAGLYTAEEFDTAYEAACKATEDRERAEYLRLKAKYEGGEK